MKNEKRLDLMITNNDYKSIFKKIPSPIYLWQKVDDDLILIDFNNVAKEITDNKITNFLGIKASELYQKKPQILEELYQCVDEQKYISREMRYKKYSL